LPSRLPVEVSFEEALDAIGMFDPEAEGDAKYTDTRIDRRNDKDGKPLHPNGISLKPYQVIGELSLGASWHLLAPNGSLDSAPISANWP